MAGTMAGGLSPTKPATPEVQTIANQVKSQFEARQNAQYSTYEAVSFRTQVVAGINYFIKVKIGAGERDYVHQRVFMSLANSRIDLIDYQMGKTKDDPITYF